MFKVRFHLGAGEHYKHWQIRTPRKGQSDLVEYEDPSKVQLELVKCTLRSKTGVAKKVLSSQVRDVCGWVDCKHIITTYLDPMVMVGDLITSGNRLYILKFNTKAMPTKREG